MGISVTPIINRSNRKNKSGQYQIQVRVTIDRQSKYFSLDERVDQSSWSGKAGKWVKESHPQNHHLNRIIKMYIDELNEFIYKQKVNRNQITMELVQSYLKIRSKSNLFNDYIKVYKREHRFESDGTLKKYNTFEKHFNEFNSSVPFSALNEGLFHSFTRYLDSKGLKGQTIKKYFDAFKRICKQAVKDGLLDKDPFYLVDLGLKMTKAKREYLELNEILKLKKAKIPSDRPDLEKTRDHWLFCFYASFYYSDLRKLKWSSIQNSDMGYVVFTDRYKNEELFIAPIHKFQHAIELIERQKGMDTEYVFPDLISDQKFNDKLKDLAKAAKIDKKLTNKMARHSSIQFWEAQGLETQHTAKIVGHSNERTTKNYYDLSVRDINTRVGKFDFSILGL